MLTIDALKELAVAVIGGGLTADAVPGETIPEVLKYIAANYPGAETLTVLTLKAVEGDTAGTCKITVVPTLTSGNTYAYKTSASVIPTPEYLDSPTGTTAWNGTADIAVEDGHRIAIYELNSAGKIVGFGQAVAVVNLG